jgi:hypothetical protein
MRRSLSILPRRPESLTSSRGNLFLAATSSSSLLSPPFFSQDHDLPSFPKGSFLHSETMCWSSIALCVPRIAALIFGALSGEFNGVYAPYPKRR